MKACEDGPISYLYCKDNTWTLAGIAADEAPPESAPSIDDLKAKHDAGIYPGQEKMPEASEAIIDGLNDCYYSLVDNIDAPPSSTRSVKIVEGQRINFGLVDSPSGYSDSADETVHERFIYIMSGGADADIDSEKKAVGSGDLLHIPKGVKFDLTITGAPTRYCYFESTPFLESRVNIN
jgi:mannose-6-phosphate isomerase-like protein (cupin superfamily)